MASRRLLPSTTRMPRRVRIALLTVLGGAVAVAVTAAASGNGLFGRTGNVALAITLTGAVSLLGWKAILEVATTSAATERAAERLRTTAERVGERVNGLGRQVAGVESDTRSQGAAFDAADARLRGTEAELHALRDELAAVRTRMAAERTALEELVERSANDVAAEQTALEELVERSANDVASQLSALVDDHRAAVRDREQLDARLNRVERLATRNGALVEAERRARLAASIEHRDLRPAVGPSEIRRLVDDIETGRTPPERASDAFPDEAIGLSGRKFRTLVCELVRELGDRGVYLEIGTYHGRTICTSALANPTVRHLGVDDFSQVNDDGRNRAIFEGLVGHLALTNIDFVQADFHEFFVERSLAGARDVSVYYFDASHDYRSQMLALLYGAQQVVEGGVMLVDDCNYGHVRAATYDFCDLNPDWALLVERYTEGHPRKVSDEVRAQMEDGWWNGVHVLVHDPRHLVERLPRPHEPELDAFFLAQHRGENCRTDEVESRRARVHEP